jgi:hypothetical protein
MIRHLHLRFLMTYLRRQLLDLVVRNEAGWRSIAANRRLVPLSQPRFAALPCIRLAGFSLHVGRFEASACRILVVSCLVAWASAAGQLKAAPFNVAPDGNSIVGAGADTLGTSDVDIVHSGIAGAVNDQDLANPGPFNITIGRSVDSYDGAAIAGEFDFVGVLFDAPQSGVNALRVQNFAAIDGGWWGASGPAQGGAPLAPSDLAAPDVQVTANGGATWTTVASTSNYVTAYTGVVRGAGFPAAGAGPLATFSFASQSGINGIRLIGNGGGNADGTGFIGVIELEVLQDEGVVFPTLNINTNTGAMTLNTGSGTARGIQGYSITSAANVGGLSPTAWLSVADNYDSGHPGANQVDANDQWTELTAAASNTDLSESQIGGDGGLLNASRSIPLGNAWIRNPFGEDIQLEILLPDGRKRRVDVTYNGTSENPLQVGDLNFDGSLTALDWPIVRNNFNANLASLTRAEAYNLGDLNSDGVNNRIDFALFKGLYDAANGVGAFEAMASTIPEPTGLTISAVGACIAALSRRSRVRNRQLT